jgi:hypothetical protein
LVFYQFLKKTERSVSLILGILGNLGHFRHSLFDFISLLQQGAKAKRNMPILQLFPDMLHSQVKQSADVLILQAVENDFTVPPGFDNP